MAVNYADSGLGWAADEDFYKLEAGDISTVGTRTYRTLSRGPVVFATVYLPATGYTGPVVISTVRDLAAYEPGGVVSQGSFDYLSFTWYITAFSYWISGNQADSSDISQKLVLSGSTAAEVGVALLRAASVVPTEYARTSTTKIYYNGSSKVIRRLCQIINSVARLGTTHDTAFYGDQGLEAYEHSQVKGNAHDLTLADLGLEKISDQVRTLLDAVGVRRPWTRHGGEEMKTHEGETIYFQTTAHLLEWH